MPPSPESVFATVADQSGAVWLDGGTAPAGWTILAWDPSDLCTEGADWPTAGRARVRGGDASVPFAGGCIGYIGFGAGHRVEPVPAQDPTPEPEVWLARYRGGLCFRHADQSWHPAGASDFVAEAHHRLAEARDLPPPPPAPTFSRAETTPRPDYEAAVRQLLEWIAAGDCYQVNLTRPVTLRGAGHPWPAYRRLRALSAPSYGAFLRLDADHCVLSNSPELFLEVRRDRVRSQPIKGTRPRHADPDRDRALALALRASPKDRAELTMIVDLVRNDLGRIAVPGSVTTSERVITAHANVHHASQTVDATLRRGIDAWHTLAASFPPGSVTGAPKIRACQRIQQLEHAPRGVYCGAIGYVADGGSASWSVAIRTAVWSGETVRYHIGGGIVSASDPAEEWLETIHKGTALAAALGAPDGS